VKSYRKMLLEKRKHLRKIKIELDLEEESVIVRIGFNLLDIWSNHQMEGRYESPNIQIFLFCVACRCADWKIHQTIRFYVSEH
jgi:hypothetical protein